MTPSCRSRSSASFAYSWPPRTGPTAAPRRAPRRLERRDLAIDPLGLGHVCELALGELRALVEEVDALGLARGGLDALPVVAVEIGEALGVVVDALEQLARLGCPGTAP